MNLRVCMSLASEMKTSCALAGGCYATTSQFFHSTLSLAITFMISLHVIHTVVYFVSCSSLANVVDCKAKLEFVWSLSYFEFVGFYNWFMFFNPFRWYITWTSNFTSKLAGDKDGLMCTHWGLLQAPDSFIRPFSKPSYLCFLGFVSNRL